MTSWAQDATEFTVSVTRNVKCKTSYSYIPKPILDMMGTPRRITFSVKDGVITVSAEESKAKHHK
ncbi:MAG: hypothetical protein J4F28_07600 [Nitrosopumilaceae archaeon]|nr:hypothetical protein [Nitrosopumilaceae archaeon]